MRQQFHLRCAVGPKRKREAPFSVNMPETLCHQGNEFLGTVFKSRP
jgi:hypothetical protein